MIIESLRKGFQIVHQSTNVILVWIIFNVLTGLFSTFTIINQIKQREGLDALPLSTIAAWGIMLIAYLYLHAGTLVYVRNKILLNHQTFLDFFSEGFKYFFSISFFNLAVFFLFFALSLIIGVIFILISFFAGFMEQIPRLSIMIMIIGFICTAAMAGASLALFMLYAPSIIVAEDSKVFKAMKKSIKVVRSHFWKTFGLGILSTVPIIILQIIGLFDDYFLDNRPIQAVLVLVSAVIASFFEIYVSSVIMNFYLGLSASAKNQVKNTVLI